MHSLSIQVPNDVLSRVKIEKLILQERVGVSSSTKFLRLQRRMRSKNINNKNRDKIGVSQFPHKGC